MSVTLLGVTVSECRTASDYKCANNLCLPKSVKCDGYDQCGDGSDENELCGAFWCFVCSLRTSSDFFGETKKFIENSIKIFSPDLTASVCE